MGRPVRRPIWCVLPCDHYPCLLLFSDFLIYIRVYIFVFKKRGGAAYFLGGLRATLFYNLGQFIGKHNCTLRLHVANYLAGSMSMLV